MNDNDSMLDMAQAYLNYSDDQLIEFKNNSNNMDILSKMPQILETKFTLEVVEANGCVCQHQAGQKIVINGDGSIAAKEGPEKICVYLLQAITPIIFSAQEFIYAGLNPNKIKIKKLGCFDVGVKCGGIGHVIIEFKSDGRNG